MTSVLASLILVTVFPQVVTSVEQGLELLEQGIEPDRVRGPVARDAAAAIEPLADDLELTRRLARLARLGNAHDDLAVALGKILAERGPCMHLAIAELGTLPEPALNAAAGRLSAESIDVVLATIRDEEDSAAVLGGIALVLPRLPASALAESLQGWALDERDHPKALQVLGHLDRCAEPAEVYSAVANLDLPATLREPTGAALRALLRRDPRVADTALELASQGQWGPGCSVLLSLGGLFLDDEERITRAASIVDSLLAEVAEGGTSGIPADAIAAATTVAGDLFNPSIVPLLSGFARTGDPIVRVAAIRAIPKVCYRDAPTIDLLIELLSDPNSAVANAAYESLQRKSGQSKIPMVVDMWTRWRASVQLPATAPETNASTRLEADRKSRGAADRRARERNSGR